MYVRRTHTRQYITKNEIPVMSAFLVNLSANIFGETFKQLEKRVGISKIP